MREPTKLECLSSVIQGTATQESQMAVKATTVRIPLVDYAAIQAMSDLTNGTRQAIINALLAAAIEQVLEGLTEERKAEVLQAQSKILAELLQDAGIESVKESLGGGK